MSLSSLSWTYSSSGSRSSASTAVLSRAVLTSSHTPSFLPLSRGSCRIFSLRGATSRLSKHRCLPFHSIFWASCHLSTLPSSHQRFYSLPSACGHLRTSSWGSAHAQHTIRLHHKTPSLFSRASQPPPLFSIAEKQPSVTLGLLLLKSLRGSPTSESRTSGFPLSDYISQLSALPFPARAPALITTENSLIAPVPSV